MNMRAITVILENIRSAHNVGAIFRTADGAGVEKIILIGYTPQPIDRFGRVQTEIKKTSLGASEFIPWEYFASATEVIASLDTETQLVVVEQTKDSIPYTVADYTAKAALVFGNEVEGVSQELIEAANVVVELPMSGQKESLNVSTTAGIVLFNVRDGWRKRK